MGKKFLPIIQASQATQCVQYYNSIYIVNIYA